MKAFLWLLTCAMGIVCFSCWAMSELALRSLHDMGYPLPNFTDMILRPHGWLLVAPLPWCVYCAVLTFRRDVSSRAAFIFSGTIIFVTTSLVCAVVIAALLPYIPLKVDHSSMKTSNKSLERTATRRGSVHGHIGQITVVADAGALPVAVAQLFRSTRA